MTLELAVDARSVLGKQTKRLRRAGNVPGVVYGKGTASIPVQVEAKQFETPGALVSRYAGLIVHGLPPDHHAHFADRLDGVSVASLAAVATRQIHPRSLVAVVVADATRVLDTLRHLEWGEVEIVVDR